MGYARGVLLKEEIQTWVRDNLYMIRKQSLGTSIGENLLTKRAKEIESFIPQEYTEELNGVSAGCGVSYDTLLMIDPVIA